MEVWKDYQTGKYFSIDNNSGNQSPSNRYGAEQTVFKANSTGFPHILKVKESPIDRLYTVQPKNFDGYCQFPRPCQNSSAIQTPYVRKWIKTSKVYIKDEAKIPKPLNFLNISQRKSFSPQRTHNSMYNSLPVADLSTIQDIKMSLVKPPLRDLRTATDLSKTLEKEKKNSTGYIMPKSKIKRRKLKGFFLKEFKTSGELFYTEKRMLDSLMGTKFKV